MIQDRIDAKREARENFCKAMEDAYWRLLDEAYWNEISEQVSKIFGYNLNNMPVSEEERIKYK